MQLMEMDHMVSLPSITGLPPPMLTGTESDPGDEITAGVVKIRSFNFAGPGIYVCRAAIHWGGKWSVKERRMATPDMLSLTVGRVHCLLGR